MRASSFKKDNFYFCMAIMRNDTHLVNVFLISTFAKLAKIHHLRSIAPIFCLSFVSF
ncbi:hypothetical protein ANACOL_02396 [Anaerotruncus colihominis DSM 17241]|uniref:Uncharacterized protein n=1 Tax=Anaerotruncus colihominis DSM 17241 TaxID=445972 RepID=B0PC86_9FIRM|nr:hypothetical protein ANACOL_02396 [Anaerotruncus colihominis DSM 17241]